jgi:hypothetical protein
MNSDNCRLLEEKTINDRTLVCWYDFDTSEAKLLIFHLTDQPNELSKKSPYTNWGYMTLFITDMYTLKEAAEIVGMYLKDIESDNFWWENIN